MTKRRAMRSDTADAQRERWLDGLILALELAVILTVIASPFLRLFR